MSTTRDFMVRVLASVGTPAWVPSTPLQVRNLIGATYGPTNGKPYIADPVETTLGAGVVPAEWNIRAQTWGAHAITQAWSGGQGDLVGRRLFVHGGGHADGANNGLYIYEFGTGARPIGWKLAGTAYGTAGCSLSPINTSGLYNGSSWGIGSDSVYADNRPTSIHSYDQQWFNSAQQRFYRFGGSACATGRTITPVYYYDLAADRWSSVLSGGTSWGDIPGPDPLSGSVSATVMASPDESKMLFVGGGRSTLRMFTSASAAFVDLGNGPGTSDSAYLTRCCVDTGSRSMTNDRWITIDSQSGTARVLDWTINWNTNAVSWTARSHATHATHLRTEAGLQSSGGSLIYDHDYGSGGTPGSTPCVWIYGTARHHVSTTALKELLCMKLSDWSIAAHTLTGDTVLPAYFGSNSRHLWFPQYRTFATVQSTASPVAAIRVPT